MRLSVPMPKRHFAGRFIPRAAALSVAAVLVVTGTLATGGAVGATTKRLPRSAEQVRSGLVAASSVRSHTSAVAAAVRAAIGQATADRSGAGAGAGVSRLRTEPRASLGTWSVGEMVVDAAHSHIFISRPSENAVEVLSFTGQLLKTITGEDSPFGMVVDSTTESLYIADHNGIGKIGLVSLDSLTPVSTSASLTGIRTLTLADGLIWTTLPTGSAVLASVAISTGIVTSFPSAGTIYDPWLVSSPTNADEFFAGTQGLDPSSVYVVTVSAGVPSISGTTLDGGENLRDMAVTADGAYVAVAHGAPYNFNLDSTTGGTEITLPGEAYPEAVAASPGQGGLVAMVDSDSAADNLSVYHVGSTSPLVQATTVGFAGARSPIVHGLAMSPTGALVFALSEDGTSVAFQEFALMPGATTTHLVALPEYPDVDSITNLIAVVSYPTGDTAGGTMNFGSPGKAPICANVPVIQVGAYGGAGCQITAYSAGSYVLEATYSGFHEAEGSSGTTSVFFHNPGYRTVTSTGTVDSFNVTPHGSHSGAIPSPIIGIGADRETGGYWLASARGDVYGLDAPFHGSLPLSHITVSRPIRSIAGTATGLGYWILDANGTVYTYGDAINFGHVVGVPASGATVALVPTADDGGYWILGSQGQILSFGDANNYGDLLTSGIRATDIVGMAATPNDGGYLIVGSDGSVYRYGNAVLHGSLKGRSVGATIGVAMDPVTGGYWMAVAGGTVYSFDAPAYGSGRYAIVGIVTG